MQGGSIYPKPGGSITRNRALISIRSHYDLLVRQAGCKPQPYVVGRPFSRRVAQVWLDAFTHTIEIVRAIPFGQHRGEAATEGRKPSHHIPGQRRGPRDQRDIAHAKASGGKSP